MEHPRKEVRPARRIALALLVCLSVLGGPAACSSTPRGEPFRPEVADETRAVVYVYRDASTGSSKRPVAVFINQQPEGELLPGQYLARVVPPGEYFVRVEGESSMVRQARLVPGDTAYFQVITGRWNNKPVVDLPDTELARRQIATSRRVE